MRRLSTWFVFGVFIGFPMVAGQTSKVSNHVVRVGPSVHVSSDLPTNPHYETEIAANPANSRQLMACSILLPYNSMVTDVVTYVSFDGGKTWKLTLRTKGEDEHHSSMMDPDCQYGPDNITYSLSEGIFELHKGQPYNRIDRSMDGGKSWDSFFRSLWAERSFLTVDHNASPQHGWLYTYGQASFELFRSGADSNGPASGLGIRVDWSPDQGKTVFHQWVPKHDGEHFGPAPGVILSDGALIFPVVVENLLPAKNRSIETERFIQIVRAEPQRTNWPLKIETLVPGKWSVNSDATGSAIPKLAVDSSDGPFRDRLYLTWEDHPAGKSQIKLSVSCDKGRTWSHPRVINADVTAQVGSSRQLLGDLHGLVAVNKLGIVGITWLDRRNYPGNLGWTVRFRASLDGGETFLPSITISSVDYDPSRNGIVLASSYSAPSEAYSTNLLGIDQFTFIGGHTMGLAADADGKFHPLWVANPTGVPQLYTTDIAVQGKAEENGGAELARLRDASKLIRLEFTNMRYDLKTHSLAFDLKLENVSESNVNTPLELRVLDLCSRMGSVMLIADDAEAIVEGAVLDFSSQLRGSVLRPGEMTKPVRVRLDLPGTDPFSPYSLSELGKEGFSRLVTLTTKVLAGSVETPKKTE